MTWVEISPESREADHILASHSLNCRTGGPGCPSGDERPALPGPARRATDWRVSIAGVDHAGAGRADRLVAVWRDDLSKGHSPRTAP
jgi:hypothetical protein